MIPSAHLCNAIIASAPEVLRGRRHLSKLLVGNTLQWETVIVPSVTAKPGQEKGMGSKRNDGGPPVY
jgi:hypothetical protein